MNAAKVIALIEQHGINGLCELDGCLCAWFKLHGVSVDISCRKSDHAIRVHTSSLDADPAGLEKVALAVLRDLQKHGNAISGYRVRFCEYEKDNHAGHWSHGVWVKTNLCCWCDKPRQDGQAYLCKLCLEKPEAIERFPWKSDNFRASVIS